MKKKFLKNLSNCVLLFCIMAGEGALNSFGATQNNQNLKKKVVGKKVAPMVVAAKAKNQVAPTLSKTIIKNLPPLAKTKGVVRDIFDNKNFTPTLSHIVEHTEESQDADTTLNNSIMGNVAINSLGSSQHQHDFATLSNISNTSGNLNSGISGRTSSTTSTSSGTSVSLSMQPNIAKPAGEMSFLDFCNAGLQDVDFENLSTEMGKENQITQEQIAMDRFNAIKEGVDNLKNLKGIKKRDAKNKIFVDIMEYWRSVDKDCVNFVGDDFFNLLIEYLPYIASNQLRAAPLEEFNAMYFGLKAKNYSLTQMFYEDDTEVLSDAHMALDFNLFHKIVILDFTGVSAIYYPYFICLAELLKSKFVKVMVNFPNSLEVTGDEMINYSQEDIFQLFMESSALGRFFVYFGWDRGDLDDLLAKNLRETELFIPSVSSIYVDSCNKNTLMGCMLDESNPALRLGRNDKYLAINALRLPEFFIKNKHIREDLQGVMRNSVGVDQSDILGGSLKPALFGRESLLAYACRYTINAAVNLNMINVLILLRDLKISDILPIVSPNSCYLNTTEITNFSNLPHIAFYTNNIFANSTLDKSMDSCLIRAIEKLDSHKIMNFLFKVGIIKRGVSEDLIKNLKALCGILANMRVVITDNLQIFLLAALSKGCILGQREQRVYYLFSKNSKSNSPISVIAREYPENFGKFNQAFSYTHALSLLKVCLRIGREIQSIAL